MNLFAMPSLGVLYAVLGLFATGVAAQDMLFADYLSSCQANSQFTASEFQFYFFSNNGSTDGNIKATSSIAGNVIFEFAVSAYGYPIMQEEIDPCKEAQKQAQEATGTEESSGFTLAGFCPMTPDTYEFPLTGFEVPADTAAQIPSIAYNFPDLDAVVRLEIFRRNDDNSKGDRIGCVEADISNGKTVDMIGVKWILAIISGLVLCASAVLNGIGHTNAAAHIASNALSLFGFFQAQAMIGLTGISLPPIVQSWTQDFQWSMGIISVDFMQDIFTWYQRSTGGEPATLQNTVVTTSVVVEKRGLASRAVDAASSAVGSLIKRSNVKVGEGSYIVYGIQRAAFKAEIESTNVFMTVLTFTCLLILFTMAGVALFKVLLDQLAKKGKIKHDTFLDFRNGWLTVMKGILFRLTLIGYPAIVIFCLWEFTQIDSAAIAVLAVAFLIAFSGTLGWGAWKVVSIARRSVAMHRNPAYILFSDPQTLNKWGFLYIQFRASAYYFILPVLGYTVLKSCFIAFAQHSNVAQAVGFLLLEAGALIGASVMRPWMDKSTNSFNIAICVVNFLNSVFLLIFSDVFDQPALVNGVIGLILFLLNAIFAAVLLIMAIVTTIMVFYRKNPDGRYQFMADDRTSFMKSQSQLAGTTELDALGASARGDKVGGYGRGLDLEDDGASISSRSLRRQTADSDLGSRPAPSFGSNSNPAYGQPPHSPMDPSTPMFPAEQRTPSPYHDNAYGGDYKNGLGAQNAQPWQRGAGYDH